MILEFSKDFSGLNPSRSSSLKISEAFLPAYFLRTGLWSKVSKWLAPPHMKRKITFLARGALWGIIGLVEATELAIEFSEAPLMLKFFINDLRFIASFN
jgi:hypothetical protein